MRVHHHLALFHVAKGLEEVFKLGFANVSRHTGDEQVGTLVLGVNIVVVGQRLLGTSVHIPVVPVISVKVPSVIPSVIPSVEVITVVSSVQVVSSVEIISVVPVVSVFVITVSHVVVVVLSVVSSVLGRGTGLVVIPTGRHASSLVGLFRRS